MLFDKLYLFKTKVVIRLQEIHLLLVIQLSGLLYLQKK